jgi:hypothetical protein
MIHEVMVLDHGGPDLAMITYSASLKMWVLGALIVGIVLPVRSGSPLLDLGAATAGMFGLAVATGLVESGMARLRLLRVPHLLAPPWCWPAGADPRVEVAGMASWSDALMIALILADLALLASGRLKAWVRIVAAQGIMLGALPLLAVRGAPDLRIGILILGGVVVRGMVFPYLLSRTMETAGVRREVEPYVGYTASLLFGIFAILASIWLSSRLRMAHPALPPLAGPAAVFTNLVGLFLIVSRGKRSARSSATW